MPLPFIWLFAFYVPFSCAFELLTPVPLQPPRRDDGDDALDAEQDKLFA